MNIYGMENCKMYCRIATKALENIYKGDRYALRSFVLVEGRVIVMLGQLESRPNKEIKTAFNLWREYAGKLTYGEFMQIYPIEKDFEGYKYGMKDYFVGVVNGKVVKKSKDESFSGYLKTKNNKNSTVSYLKLVK